MAGLALHGNLSAVFLNEVKRNGKAQSGAFAHLFGSKKRFENPVQFILRNTAAGIGDIDDDNLPLPSGFNFDLPLFFDGLGRVDQKVHEDLVELAGVAHGLGDLSIGLFHGGLVLQFVPDDVESAFQPLIEIRQRVLRFIQSGEAFQILDNLLQAVTAVQ